MNIYVFLLVDLQEVLRAQIKALGLLICLHLMIYFYLSVIIFLPVFAVPPATPVCKVQGKQEVKANVTLTCLSSSGKPVPTYKWSKTSPASEIFFSPMLSKFFLQIRASLFAITLTTSGKIFCGILVAKNFGKI